MQTYGFKASAVYEELKQDTQPQVADAMQVISVFCVI